MNNNRQLIYTLITIHSEVKRNQKKQAKQKKNVYIHCVWWEQKKYYYRRQFY